MELKYFTGEKSAVNPQLKGTKVAAWYVARVRPGDHVEIRSRLYQEDEKPIRVLRQERFVGGRLNLALELTSTQVRAWVGAVVSVHPVRGLRDHAPAAIGVTLPKDAVVERVVISPKVAR